MRQRLLKRKSVVAIAIVIGGACLGETGSSRAQSSTVRLAVVFTPEDSGLLAELLPDFEKQTGYSVQVDSRNDVYTAARQGRADLVISHYGHSQAEAFLTEGLGLWPRPVFANQSSLIGPSSDPAGIRGLTDAVEAFRRIAETRSPFIVDNGETEKYLGEVLWEAADRPDQDGWYIDEGFQGQEAVKEADRRGGYTLWGLVPFLIFQGQSGIDMEALNVADPLLQRVMVSVVVNPDQIPGVNVDGARALERYLIGQGTQARIRAFRYPGFPHQMWWPAGRNNSSAFLMTLQ
jgi:tungstate transport system substrate-binding protein